MAGDQLEASVAVGPNRSGATVTIVVAAFGAFLAFMDSTVVNVAFPSLESAYPHATVGDLSWVLNGYNIVFAGLLVLAGRFADLLGRRRLFAIGLVVFTVMSALCAASTAVAMLIVFRVLQGAGAAMLVPASLGIVIHASPAERRSHALSLWAAAGALAAGLGPPIGGALVDLYNWRLVFVINVPLGILGWYLTRHVVLESRAPGRRAMPDLRGALALSLGLSLLTLGIVEGSSWGWSSAGVVACFVVAALSALATAQSSRRHPSPILDPRVLAVRGFAVSTLVVVACGFGQYAYLLTHILWLHEVWGYSLLVSGLAVAPGAVVAALSAVPFGKLADRVGPRAIVVPGALVWAGAFVWYSTRVGVHPDFLGAWLPGQVLSGIGVGATLPVATSGGLATVPAGRYATVAAVSTSARQIGGVLGIAALAVLLTGYTRLTFAGDLRHGWEMAAGSFTAAAVIALFFGRVRASHDDAVAELHAPHVSLATPLGLDASGASPAPESFLDLLDPVVRDELLAAAVRVELPAGEALFSAGDPAHALYVVESGRLRVELAGGGVRELGAGAVVGELALLTDAARSATVVARRDSVLVAITRDTFERVGASHPEVMHAVARALAQMLQVSRPLDPPLPPPARVIALVALDDAVPTEALGEALVAALSARRPAGAPETLTVTALRAGDAVALERAERSATRVLLVAGPSGAWHDASLRQADRVILATSGAPAPSAPRPEVRTDVVVTGPAAPDAASTLAWHAATGCRRVLWAGPDPAAWAARLAPLVDRLAGCSVGLVLGGGGARALCHLGVFEAFERAGISVDRLAGTSVGAFLAALYATGASAADVYSRAFEELVQRHPFSDYHVSFTSLSRGERQRAMLRRCFGDAHLEALSRELVVASTSLYERAPLYHRSGLVADVLAASMSAPVLFAPRRVDGRVLLDGSLTDNCPVAPFVEEPEGPLVVVRVDGLGDPGEERVPSLGETLVRVMQMGDRQPEALRSMPAVTVIPDTRGVGLLEFHQIDTAMEAGRAAGEAAVSALRQRTWAHAWPETAPAEVVPSAAT